MEFNLIQRHNSDITWKNGDILTTKLNDVKTYLSPRDAWVDSTLKSPCQRAFVIHFRSAEVSNGLAEGPDIFPEEWLAPMSSTG